MAPGDTDHALSGAIRTDLAQELSRRDFLVRAGGLGAAAAIATALPFAARMAVPARSEAAVLLNDATLQAFFDTMVPGKKVPGLKTELGNEIHPKAIAGVDREHGAVYTDALLLAHNPKLGFDALVAPFLGQLEPYALAEGGDFLDLDFDGREAVCIRGFDFTNPTRLVWEAAAAVPFTAFCAAANVRNATDKTAAGYAVMGHPGTAPHGYKDFSYAKPLARERTKNGSLP
jgi:hypothetical protein